MSIIVQPKYDGIRLVCHRDKERVFIQTEDKKRDRARVVPEIVKELKSLRPDKFIIDTEFVIWRDGEPIPREKMMMLVVGNKPVHEDIHVNVHDVLWYGEKGAINELPYIERLKYLDKLLPKDLKYLKKSPSWIVTNRKEFDAALKKAYAYPGSEGCITGDTPIVTIDSEKSAKWIVPGDYVLSKDGDYHKVLKVSIRLATENDSFYYIKTFIDGWQQESFVISGNHQILTKGDCWIRTDQLSNAQAVSHPTNNQKTFIEIAQLRGLIDTPLYDFEIENENSYCTPSVILHNSMLKSADSQYLPGVGRTVDWCIGADTPIIGLRGVIPAQEIKAGDFVLSKDKSYHRVLRVAVRLATDEDEIYQISAQGEQPFLISGNHEIHMGEKVWVQVKDLPPTTLVPHPTSPSNGTVINTFIKIRRVHRAINIPLYDFEIEDENSYCTPYVILHNSKIKIVKEAAFKIIGRLKKAMPFETIGRDQPKVNVEGEAALKLYKRLQEKSKTWILRCALKDGDKYRTIDTEDTVTESDLHVRWNAGLTKPKWQGLDDPGLWEMLKGFEHRKPGEQAFGATYAKSFDIEPKLGMIVTVSPVQIIEFTGNDGKKKLAWMFPKVRELRPDAHEPDDLHDIRHLIEVRKIRNIENYDPAKANDKQLRDDMRIAMAWYATWKKNPNSMKFTREEIKETLKKVIKELIKRGPDVIQFSPNAMKASSREIFNEIREEVNIPANMLKIDIN
jgi:hypothetical protein